MLWQPLSFPKCKHHVFLSHCQDDGDSLVRPVYESLSKNGIDSFIDVADFYYGRDSRSALKDAILDSRHVIFFITDAMLNYTRGWCVLELAYAELVDSNLHFRGGKAANAMLPLFLLPQADERLPRSVWQAVRDKGRFIRPEVDRDPIAWCSQQIQEFLGRELDLSKKWAKLARENRELSADLRGVSGRFDRVTKFQPRLPKL